MDLSRRLLDSKEFPLRRKGYDQDAVDDFLERVGVAIDELQGRLRTAEERVHFLETIAGAAKDNDGELSDAHRQAVADLAQAELEVEKRRGDLEVREKDFARSSEELVVSLEARKIELERAVARNEDERKAVLATVKIEAAQIRAQAEVDALNRLEEADAQSTNSSEVLEQQRDEMLALETSAAVMRQQADELLRAAERSKSNAATDVETLTADAEDLLAGAQEAAENILRDARAKALELEAAAATSEGAVYSPAAAVLLEQGRAKVARMKEDALVERETLLSDVRTMKDEAEERVQRATLLRDEAERLVKSANSSADLARESALKEARAIVANERRQARADAEAMLSEARREREAFLADARKDAEEMVGAARRSSDELDGDMVAKREALDAYQGVVDEARREAEIITSEAVAESARVMAAAQVAANQRADKIKERMRGEVSDLERARSNMRFEVTALGEQITEQQERLTQALEEAQNLNHRDLEVDEPEEPVDEPDLPPEIGLLTSDDERPELAVDEEIEQLGGVLRFDESERIDDGDDELDETQQLRELEEIGGVLRLAEPEDEAEEAAEGAEAVAEPVKRRRRFRRRKE
jgi:DivIVA domain-containing protein